MNIFANMDRTGAALPTQTAHAADRLLANRSRLLHLWEQRARSEIAAATHERHPILIDTLPLFLHNLAEALSPHHPRGTATEGTTLAEEHGGERVRVTHYRLDDVIREYQLLRDVLFEELGTPEPLTDTERHIILKSIDKAMCEACTAYVLVADGIREQLMLTLAHDLRGPLSAARAGASLILRRPDAPDVPRWAAKVQEGIDRVDSMVRDLLDVSLLRTGGRLTLELGPCELAELARAAVEQLELVHGERFLVVAREPVHGFWSAEALRRAIENLAVNAVKYGHGTRPITLSVGQTHERALLTVHNEGSYIPTSERETLFLAFQRSREAEQSGQRGWGLGLALVRGVAEAHGGSIGVDSLPEKGTSFIIDIPKDSRPFQECPTTP